MKILKIVGAILLLSSVVLGVVPSKLMYMGRLADADNHVVNGYVEMRFKFYSDSTGTTPFKTIEFVGDDSIEVSAGYFFVVMDLSDVIDSLNQTVYLEVDIYNKSTSSWETSAERERLVAQVPYTIWAHRSAVAETANVISSGAVQTSTPITGDGTSSSPISLTYGSGLTLSGSVLIVDFDNSTIDTNSAGKIRVKPSGITSTEINDDVVFSKVQNASGTLQFAVTDGNAALQFAASGMNSVSFDSDNHRVTYTATANTNVPITGNGTSGSPLSLNYGTGLTLSGSDLIINESDIPYTPSDVSDWSGSVDPGDVNDALDQLASRTTNLESGSNNNYIRNQYSSAQSASFWISGKGKASQLIAVDTLFLGDILKIYLKGDTIFYASDSVLDFGGGLIIEKDNDVKVTADLYIPSATVNTAASTLLAITNGKVEKILKSSVTAGVSSITGGLGLEPDDASTGDVTMTVDMTELHLKGLVATTYDSLRVKIDGNTICFGGSNELQVCYGGISTNHISDGTIIDNDISSSAAIQWTKISKSGSSIDDLGDVNTSSAASGDILYYDGSKWTILSAGTSGYVLHTNGAGAAPSWGTMADLIAGDGLKYTSAGNYNGIDDKTLQIDIADSSLTFSGSKLKVSLGKATLTTTNYKIYRNY